MYIYADGQREQLTNKFVLFFLNSFIHFYLSFLDRPWKNDIRVHMIKKELNSIKLQNW